MDIGNNIKVNRSSSGLTQKQLAEKLNVNINTIQNYESGRRTPSIEIITKIAKTLDIPIMDLITDENNLVDKNFSDELLQTMSDDRTFYFQPSVVKEMDNSTNEYIDIMFPVIKYVNNVYCEGKYNLKEILINGNGAFKDISDLVIDVVKNRLVHYNNLNDKNK